MNYLYHKVPEPIEGAVLYPLSVLKDKYPEIYTQHISKYAGREHVTENRIPAFNLLWNDVLHFAAVHPKDLKDALIEAGMNTSIKFRFYQIDPSILDPEDCIVYLNNRRQKGEPMSEKDFTAYNQEDIPKYSVLRQEAKDNYKEKFSQGKKPLMFGFVPHVLYRGSVDISQVPIIEC